MNMEVIDMYTNPFMDLKNDYTKEELKKHIGEYMIIRSYVTCRLKDKISEFIAILTDVTDECIKVKPNKVSNKSWVIEYERLKECEFLNGEYTLEDFDLENYRYVVEITNIYNKKIQGIIEYIDYDTEYINASEINFCFKFPYKTKDYAYESTTYPVGLIKNIKVIDKYNLKNIMNILNDVSKYYKINLEDLINPRCSINEERLTKAIKIISKIENISYDYIGTTLNCNYNFITESIDYINDNDEEILLNYNSIKKYLNHIDKKDNSYIETGIEDISIRRKEITSINNIDIAVEILLNNARNNMKVLYYSLNESRKQILNRLISKDSYIDLEKINNNKLTWTEKIEYVNSRERIDKYKIILEDKSLDIDKIKPDILFIDDKNIDIDELKNIAKKLNIAVLILSDINADFTIKTLNKYALITIRDNKKKEYILN